MYLDLSVTLTPPVKMFYEKWRKFPENITFYFQEVSSIFRGPQNEQGCGMLPIDHQTINWAHRVGNRNWSQKVKGILLTSCTCRFLQHHRKGIQTDIQQSWLTVGRGTSSLSSLGSRRTLRCIFLSLKIETCNNVLFQCVGSPKKTDSPRKEFFYSVDEINLKCTFK